MDDIRFDGAEDQWEAGFESGRSVVVTRLGPILRVFPRPERFVRRFYHRVHELPIHHWQLEIEPLQLGSFCTIATSVAIRFQPTVRYARENLEFLPRLADHIKNTHHMLLTDQVDAMLREMETAAHWVERGCGPLEKAIERDINESMAIRNIQCRSRCTITPTFGAIEGAKEISPWSRHRAVYLELLRRQREAAEQVRREEHEKALDEQRRKLEQEEQLLAIARREAELRRARLEREIESLRSELSAEETLQAEQRDSETRLREEQIRHTARLRELEMDADINEKTRRAQTMDDMEEHIKREIELLAMERQRLLLEEEVREVKVAKAKGWVINAKRRFPLGDDRTALHSGSEGGPDAGDPEQS